MVYSKILSARILDPTQITILRRNQPFSNVDTTDIFGLCVTTMILNFHDIPSTPTNKHKNHSNLLFDLISFQDATELFVHPNLIGEPLSPKSNFTFP